LGGYWSMNIEARLDEEYGVFFGNGYLKDEQGRWMLDDDGMPQIDNVRRVLGNYNPDWVGGLQNRFSYGPLELSVLVDGQKGGSIFSTSNWFGEYSGVLEQTLRGRENDICDPGIVVRGVLPDGSINGDGTNDKTVCPQDYFHANFGNHEASIADASYLKLREVRLGYTINAAPSAVAASGSLPQRFISRLGFSGVDIGLIGRNLFLWSNIKNIDPETAFDASNVQGIEFGQFPTARSIGLTLSIRP
ncbi:MAG: SusC/RagA family TonB-linked outer membrane protein, partial [Longimicrobiales bacterium]